MATPSTRNLALPRPKRRISLNLTTPFFGVDGAVVALVAWKSNGADVALRGAARDEVAPGPGCQVF